MSAPWTYRGAASGGRKAFQDPQETMEEILLNLTLSRNLPEGKRIAYLNTFVQLMSKPDIRYDDFLYTPEEILLCLRPNCFLESTKLRNAVFRAVRHFIKTEEHVDLINKLKYDYLIAREITAGGLQLCRKILVIAPHKLTQAPVRAIVAFAHPSHTDNLQSAALAFLAELALLNPSVFISCGGVSALIQPLPSLRSPKMTEALLGPLLFLANKPDTRHKSGLNLQCLTSSVYMDPSFTSNKNNNPNNDHVKWSTTALLCLMRSWTGLFHLCQGKKQAVASIVNSLYVSHLQKPMLEVLYKLLCLTQPEWTDEMSVALAAVSPSRWQDCFRISEGFLPAEASALLPHLAKSGVNLTEVHKAVVLYLFLESNLLDAIIHVIVSDDTFLSVHATVLLGQILHLVHTILPPELTGLTPGLPNLISYAVRGNPIDNLPGLKAAIAKHKEWNSFNSDANLTLDDFLNPGLHQVELGKDCDNHRREAQGRALSAILAMSCLHKKPAAPSLYLSHLISCLKQRYDLHEKPSLIVHNSCDEAIKESGVMTIKDPFLWNWDVIRAILNRHGESLKRATDSTRRLFLRRLVNFILPVTGQYGRKEIGSDRKSSNRLTLAALSLITLLLSSPDETDAFKYLMELLGAIRLQLEDVTTAKSAHDCLLSPVNVTNSLCQDYFLFIGHLSRTAAGRKTLEKSKIYQHLIELVSTTNHDCYIKLIISTLDYTQDEMARQILKLSLESKYISCKLYATKFLHTLIRIGIGHDKSLMNFIIGLIVCQAGDPDRNVARVALDTLQEATHCKEYVEAIVEAKPCLLRHGDSGLLLLIRCLSSEQGFKALHQGNFIQSQLSKWGVHYNYRYVNILESLLATHNSSNGKDVLMPPHLYQQLARHEAGLAMVLADPHVAKYIQALEKTGDPEGDEELLETKAALYSLSGVAAVLDDSVVQSMIRIATTSAIYSLRAVAVIALRNVAVSVRGIAKLQAFNWHSVQHNRHERWPLIPTRLFTLLEHDMSTSEFEKSHLYELPEESLCVPLEEGEDTYWSIPGGDISRSGRERRSATLPHHTSTPAFYHNRSYSESKAEQSDGSDYLRYEGGRKSRSNSYTDSSTSGDSSYNLRHSSYSERFHRLSPIPSSGSLITYHPPHTRRLSSISTFSRSCDRQGSEASLIKSLEPEPSLPFGITTYGELHHHLSPITRPKPMLNLPPWGEAEAEVEPDFSTLDREAQPQPGSDQSSTPELPVPLYIGITLPVSISVLLPKEEKKLQSHHVQFVSQNHKAQGIEELKNPSFHREICFLGPKSMHNTMVNTSESEGQYIVEIEKEPLEDNSSDEDESSISDVELEKPMPIIFKSPAVIRSELTRMVEQLSNPILHKTCKQSLLQIKQAHGELFKDVCVYSDVCHVLSTCQMRVASRDILNELFDYPFEEVWSEAGLSLQEAQRRRLRGEA